MPQSAYNCALNEHTVITSRVATFGRNLISGNVQQGPPEQVIQWLQSQYLLGCQTRLFVPLKFDTSIFEVVLNLRMKHRT